MFERSRARRGTRLTWLPRSRYETSTTLSDRGIISTGTRTYSVLWAKGSLRATVCQCDGPRHTIAFLAPRVCRHSVRLFLSLSIPPLSVSLCHWKCARSLAIASFSLVCKPSASLRLPPTLPRPLALSSSDHRSSPMLRPCLARISCLPLFVLLLAVSPVERSSNSTTCRRIKFVPARRSASQRSERTDKETIARGGGSWERQSLAWQRTVEDARERERIKEWGRTCKKGFASGRLCLRTNQNWIRHECRAGTWQRGRTCSFGDATPSAAKPRPLLPPCPQPRW